MCAGEHADQVYGQQPLPLAGVGIGEEPELVGAGVVDEDRERAVLGDQVDRRLRLGDVQRGGLGADLAGERPGAVEVEVSDHDVGALGGEPCAGRRPDPARAAGDEHLLTLESHRRRSICPA